MKFEVSNRKKFLALAGIAAAAIFGAVHLNGGDKSSGNNSGEDGRRLMNGYDDTLAGIPSYTDSFANVWEPIDPSDQPLFWYIGLAGGQTWTSIAASCLGLTQCSPKGDDSGNDIPIAPPVQVVKHTDDGAPYLNVNPSTEAGIDQMVSLNVVGDRLADMIVTPRLIYSSKLFNAANKGRVFAMFRHPVKRLVDQFYYRQAATWDPYFDPQLATMSIDDYAESSLIEDNFVTRSLLGMVNETTVSPADLQLAKDILREKVIVGIQEWLEASIVRFETYFGWWDKYNVATDQTVNQCHSDQVENQVMYPNVVSGAETWQKLSIRNWADVELYSYAKRLFAEQNKLITV